MLRFLLRRILISIPVLLAISFMTFVMVSIAPGGPFDQDRAMPPEIREALDAHYGFDGKWLVGAVQGDLGPTFAYTGWSVNEVIANTFPVSLQLGLISLIIALSVGLPAGIIAALKKNSIVDYLPMSLAIIGICLPTFVMGPLLALFFGLQLGWFNPLGWEYLGDRILPSATLGFFYGAYLARLTRGGMLEVLSSDWIRTARAKGLSERTIVLKHALRAGMLPVINFLGPAFAGLVSGSFIIESIFFIPGLGRQFILAAFNRDYFLVMGTVMFYATLIIIMNILVDFLQVLINPKLRHADS